MTQVEKILRTFARGMELSSYDAMVVHGIGHLSSVISLMTKEMHIPIDKQLVRSKSGATYMSYSMNEEDAKHWLKIYTGVDNG